jgi:hypothetical protein
VILIDQQSPKKLEAVASHDLFAVFVDEDQGRMLVVQRELYECPGRRILEIQVDLLILLGVMVFRFQDL